MTEWMVPVIDSLKIKGKPANWFPSAESLVAAGVPILVARRWKRERYAMTVGLRRRVKQDKN